MPNEIEFETFTTTSMLYFITFSSYLNFINTCTFKYRTLPKWTRDGMFWLALMYIEFYCFTEFKVRNKTFASLSNAFPMIHIVTLLYHNICFEK